MKGGRRGLRRRGAILIYSAFSLVALVGIMAISLDCGAMMAERRRAQAVADAAAMAAACDLSYNFAIDGGADPAGTARASALATASASGYASNGTTSQVRVYIPPASGDHAGKAGYAEVVVIRQQPRIMSGIFGSGPLSVSCRAVARGVWQPRPIGLMVLEPYLPAALTLAAGTSLSVPNGSIIVNSISLLSTTIALGGSIKAMAFDIAGGGLSLLSGPIIAPLRTGVEASPDPLGYLKAPERSTLPVQRSSLLTVGLLQNTTINPGVYNGGIRVAATGKLTMTPGIYYMNGGGFTVAGAGSVTGLGVTIVNAPILPIDGINIAGTGNVVITPPTTGVYRGISIIQSPELISLPLDLNPNIIISANTLLGGTFSIGGTIYAPLSIAALTANGTAKIGGQVVVRMAIMAGLGTVHIGWDQNTARIPLPIKLVE